jgi:3-dehydroquinate dehydratase II
MIKLLIVNGPNLNLLGSREPVIYGDKSFPDFFEKLKKKFTEINFEYFHSNHPGKIIDRLHDADKEKLNGIILNAGAYTHTSLALADAISAIKTPVVEVHISNIYNREKIRQNSFISPNCKGIITGFGLDSYTLAVISFLGGM